MNEPRNESNFRSLAEALAFCDTDNKFACVLAAHVLANNSSFGSDSASYLINFFVSAIHHGKAHADGHNS